MFALALIVFALSALIGAVSLLGIVYPFRPFGTRKRAALSLVGCFVLLIGSTIAASTLQPPPAPETTASNQAPAPAPAPAPASTAAPEPAPTPAPAPEPTLEETYSFLAMYFTRRAAERLHEIRLAAEKEGDKVTANAMFLAYKQVREMAEEYHDKSHVGIGDIT